MNMNNPKHRRLASGPVAVFTGVFLPLLYGIDMPPLAGGFLPARVTTSKFCSV